MKTIAILACKLLRFAGKLLGKGSSLPGSVALKLDPDILQKIKLPDRVIAVTGSNGKTSTVEMIAHVLRQNGWKVAYNREGSNQIEGVTTFLLSAIGVRVGAVFGARFRSGAELAGGVILVLMGLKILLEHLGFLG